MTEEVRHIKVQKINGCICRDIKDMMKEFIAEWGDVLKRLK